MKKTIIILVKFLLAIPFISTIMHAQNINTYQTLHAIAQEYKTFMHEENTGGKRRNLRSFYAQALANFIDKIKAGDTFAPSLSETITGTILLHLFPGYFLNELIQDGLIYLSPEECPRLNTLVKNLAEKIGINPPVVFSPISKKVNNAFSTAIGTKTSQIIVDEEVIYSLNEEQLTAVLAHELAHIKHAHSTKMLGYSLLMHCLIPISFILAYTHYTTGIQQTKNALINIFIQICILSVFTELCDALLFNPMSQKFEYEADATAIVATNNPVALTTSLEVLEANTQKLCLQEQEYLHTQITSLKKKHPKLAAFLEYMTTTLLTTNEEDAPTTHPSNKNRAAALGLGN